MNKEILMVTEAVSNEKGVERDIIFEAIEQALEMATKKRFEEGANIRVVIDRETGGYESFRWWEVVADDVLAELGTQFTTEEAYEKDPDLSVGDLYEERVENAKFGRIAAQAAKQVIVQRVKEAEREIIVDRFKHRVGELLNGTVKKVTREHVVIDFGDNAEGLLPREQLVGREIFRINDRTRTILMAIREDTRGPQLLVSRISPEMLIQLFRIEVPEIAEGVIEIKGAARDPGQRAKIAVKSKDARIDPVGACVGMRGARVQAVSNDLDDERVDIVLWDDNPAQLVINAMAPAEVGSIVVDEESHSMDVAVNEENLAQAIGKGGQNVRLASELTGWNINVMTLQDAVNLVLYAFKFGKPGEIFVQKAPSTDLKTLAEAVKNLFQSPKHPVNIIGTRHGEKLFEVLLSLGVITRPVTNYDLPNYLRISVGTEEENKYFLKVLPQALDLIHSNSNYV